MMRMKKIWPLVLLAVLAAAAASSCGKDEPTPVTPEKPDTPVTPDPPQPKVVDFDKYALKEVAAKAGLKLGVSFTYWEYRNNTQVANILKRDFAAVTFGNEMKHDAIVQQGGAYNFTNADQMARWANDCGTELFGHTLGWHSQQQRTYLNNLISKASRNNNASLLKQNWNFEAGTLDGFRADGFEIFQSLYDVFAGDYAAKAASDGATLTVDASLEAGKPYTFSFWAKTLAKEGSLQVAAGDGQSLRTSVTGKWHKYSVPFTLESLGDFAFRITASKDVVVDNVRILGEGGGGVEAVTYYLDDIRLEPASSAASAPRRGVPPAFNTLFSLDGELVNDVIGYVYRDWVYTMVEHFDAYGWDVVNETFSDWPAGAFRTPQNTSGEVFVWGQYFKSTKDWVDKAFAYATDALARNGKTAVLYLNDYNLETSSDKRKAYCDYVKGNPQVTGVGTQMHLDMGTPDLKNLIVASLTDLKNTGRMVRISELDIKCTSLTDQADLYKFIFQKYLEIVPEAQRGGITIWGINDKDSWVKQEQDGRQNMPLLYQGVNYARKPAWETLYLYLCEVAGLDPYKE